jgi:hypothetical protein
VEEIMVPAYFHDMEVMDNRMSVLEERVDNLTDLMAQTLGVLKEYCKKTGEILNNERISKEEEELQAE